MNAQRESFENFKSDMCHKLRSQGDMDFLTNVLKEDYVSLYYKNQWYAECFYTLAMIDYLCRINDIPLVTNYNSLRSMKLKEILYPVSLVLFSEITNQPDILSEAFNNSIPEFKKFNIVENEVRNVV